MTTFHAQTGEPMPYRQSLLDVVSPAERPVSSEQEWAEELAAALRRLLRSGPVTPDALRRSFRFFDDITFLQLPLPFLVVTGEGGMMASWAMGRADVDVEFRPDGETEILAEDFETQEDWEGRLPDDQEALIVLLKRMRARLRG